MSHNVREDDFWQEWEYHYLRSVQAAVSVAYERAVWLAADEVYVVLSEELDRRAVEAPAGFVYDTAELISQGGCPAIMRVGRGRHRCLDGPVIETGPANYSGRHVRPRAAGVITSHSSLLEDRRSTSQTDLS